MTVNGKVVLDPSTVISAPQLAEMLSILPTKNIIVILDSCYSGGFVPSGSSIDGSPASYYSMASYSALGTAIGNFGSLLVANASASGGKTPIVLSAAGSAELSYETAELSHGVFTYYLLEAATKGDKDGDGIVTTTEAYSYASEAIKSKFDSVYGASFLPHISGDTRDLALFTN
jgi:helicase